MGFEDILIRIIEALLKEGPACAMLYNHLLSVRFQYKFPSKATLDVYIPSLILNTSHPSAN